MDILRCEECGSLYIPPKYLCTKCGSEVLKVYLLSGSGTILTYTSIGVAPEAFKKEAPYDLALVELDEGLKVTARVGTRGKAPLSIGERVYFWKKTNSGYWFSRNLSD